MAGATVTIDKTYFETLLRKANVHGSEPAYNNGPSITDNITVTKGYHDELVRLAREYNALRNSLISGGVTVENLELLIRTGLEDDQWTQNGIYISVPLSSGSSDAGVPLASTLVHRESSAIPIHHPPTPTTQSFRTQPESDFVDTSVRSPQTNGHGYHRRRNVEDYANSDATTKQDDHGSKKGYEFRDGASARNRTIFFTNLSDKTTYASLLEAVRGGAVVDAWMKPSDHCASISFVEPEAAEAFYRYAKKNDIYIDGRRINLEWREPARQFVVLPNILRQIHAGATRNLLLCNIPSNLTEQRLLDDLDHIANLSVEKIVFDKVANTVQVNLNSVCVACFARTCLKSRAFYKRIKVDFGIDECAKSLPDFKAYRKETPRQNLQEKKIANRFDALALDDDNDDDDDDDDDGLLEDNGTTESWADSVINNPNHANQW
ncbi:hypothetical protein RUND412_001587 [Rhizina undulata]